jgi:hypothetical protein
VPSEEECPIRAAAWDDKLIQAVMRKDAKGNGVFGKLKVSSCLFCFHGIPYFFRLMYLFTLSLTRVSHGLGKFFSFFFS